MPEVSAPKETPSSPQEEEKEEESKSQQLQISVPLHVAMYRLCICAHGLQFLCWTQQICDLDQNVCIKLAIKLAV